MSRSALPEPRALALDHPGLVHAAGRLRRALWVWAALFAGMGLLAFTTIGRTHPMVAISWLVIAIVLVIDRQPAFLALVSAQWGLSLIVVVPGVAAVFGGDPITMSLGGTLPEVLGLSLVRLILMVTAWNQFLFYRMLYGTTDASGLDQSLPSIPEVIRNRSNALAWLSRLVGFLAVSMVLAALALRASSPVGAWLSLALLFSTLAMGVGLGAAFSPTQHRGQALTGVGLGLAAFVGGLAVSAFFATARGL
jgi:hypothetical protein